MIEQVVCCDRLSCAATPSWNHDSIMLWPWCSMWLHISIYTVKQDLCIVMQGCCSNCWPCPDLQYCDCGSCLTMLWCWRSHGCSIDLTSKIQNISLNSNDIQDLSGRLQKVKIQASKKVIPDNSSAWLCPALSTRPTSSSITLCTSGQGVTQTAIWTGPVTLNKRHQNKHN